MDEIKEKKIKKEKKRKVEVEIGPVETLEAETVAPSSEKKKQKEIEKEDIVIETPEPENKKKRKSDESPEATSTASPSPEEKKKKRSKRIAGEDADIENGSESVEKGSDGDALVVLKDGAFLHMGRRLEKEDPGALENFRISAPLKAKLEFYGIKSLSTIQMMTFNHVLDGFDLVAGACTGKGNTHAFVLPILESLTNSPRAGYGRSPKCSGISAHDEVGTRDGP